MLSITNSLPLLRQRFESGITRTESWRREKLNSLRSALLAQEEAIYGALHRDLHKNREEAYVTELGLVLQEIGYALKHLGQWMRPEKVRTNLLNLPSSSRILKEPMGTVLIIGPWNYPLMLLLGPLTGALAAGNTVVLKPSEHAPATAMVMRNIVQAAFAPDEVLYAEGDGAELVPAMMQAFRFDHIFFTGGKKVATQLYAAAAKDLVPVTLELGGKSPCIVSADADLPVAARRICSTKFSNAGQMCIAPDYLLVQETVYEATVQALKACINRFYSDDPLDCAGYGRIINDAQFSRLEKYLQEGEVLHGGQVNREQKFIAPTLLGNVLPGAAVMQEEIFGPILPILRYRDETDALEMIRRNPDPLAFYLFTKDPRKEAYWLQQLPFGGGCINNASWHFTNHRLPFGGRGASGIGMAHGRYSFDTFTHRKSVLKTPLWFDPALKYPPFQGKLSLIKKLIG